MGKKLHELTCLNCGNAFLKYESKIKLGKGKYCSRSCADIAKRKPLAERLWVCVAEPNARGCRLWLGAKSNGYGSIGEGGLSDRMLAVHKVAWELVNGPVPKGLCVCHSCDVRNCVEVSHLFLGTYQDNSDDMKRKGRQGRRRRIHLKIDSKFI